MNSFILIYKGDDIYKDEPILTYKISDEENLQNQAKNLYYVAQLYLQLYENKVLICLIS